MSILCCQKPSRIYKIHLITFYKWEWPFPLYRLYKKTEEMVRGAFPYSLRVNWFTSKTFKKIDGKHLSNSTSLSPIILVEWFKWKGVERQLRHLSNSTCVYSRGRQASTLSSLEHQMDSNNKTNQLDSNNEWSQTDSNRSIPRSLIPASTLLLWSHLFCQKKRFWLGASWESTRLILICKF